MTTQPAVRRAVCTPPHNHLWLETEPGSGDYQRIDGQFCVMPWREDGHYIASDTVRVFKNEKTAQRFADRHHPQYVVRSTMYLRLSRS